MKEYRLKGTIKAEIYHGAPGIINTSLGAEKVDDGDYIVYSDNECYPVKAEIFEKTYEEIE